MEYLLHIFFSPKNLSVIGKFEIYAVSQFEDLQSINLFKMLAPLPLSFCRRIAVMMLWHSKTRGTNGAAKIFLPYEKS
jgi:hypothetical protein